ncbi:mycothiol acetyltransferase [Kitasatospora sp. NE20-6]|uniref:mycothiol synthase n=1 Tax=Kitasatospora sp. NE20-6 TaxID=2859066 RepID=UPI0034DBAFF3
METTPTSLGGERIRVTSVLSSDDLAVARAVLTSAAVDDGREAVSEAGRLRLREGAGRPGVRHVLQTLDGRPAGYGQLDVPEAGGRATAEFAVHPELRRRGLGRRLAAAVVAAADPAEADPSAADPADAGTAETDADASGLDVWAHGGHPGAARLAERYGAVLVRELRQMRRPSVEVPAVVLPDGVELRTFRPGEDDKAWLRLNALAFAHHPEQGAWTEADLADRLAEPWFDPAGFFLATRGGELVGFHWTKMHPDGLGEVYVVGVDPEEQGGGLGRALTSAGLRHLYGDRGVPSVLLYVDADNPAAVRVYERLGFTVHEVDLMYRVPAGAVPGASDPQG